MLKGSFDRTSRIFWNINLCPKAVSDLSKNKKNKKIQTFTSFDKIHSAESALKHAVLETSLLRCHKGHWLLILISDNNCSRFFGFFAPFQTGSRKLNLSYKQRAKSVVFRVVNHWKLLRWGRRSSDQGNVTFSRPAVTLRSSLCPDDGASGQAPAVCGPSQRQRAVGSWE